MIDIRDHSKNLIYKHNYRRHDPASSATCSEARTDAGASLPSSPVCHRNTLRWLYLPPVHPSCFHAYVLPHPPYITAETALSDYEAPRGSPGSLRNSASSVIRDEHAQSAQGYAVFLSSYSTSVDCCSVSCRVSTRRTPYLPRSPQHPRCGGCPEPEALGCHRTGPGLLRPKSVTHTERQNTCSTSCSTALLH